MKCVMKKLITLACAAALLACHAAALPYNTDIYTNYNYSSSGEIVRTPAAYIPVKRLGYADMGADAVFQISDLFVDDTYIYILDVDNGVIYMLDHDFKPINAIRSLNGSSVSNTLASPEGLFVSEKGEIYIADTQNSRIVVCDRQGTVIREYADPNILVLSEKVDFFPIKITVDKAGRIFVVAKNVNRGIVELDSDGRWSGFVGAPKVTVNWSTYIYRMFATEEQIRRMESFVPTEYNNVDIDSEGFVYATVGALGSEAIKAVVAQKDKSGTTTPIRKLNAAGDDILKRNGFFAPVGDLKFGEEGCSLIVDVAVRENGIYTLADSRRGRLFTYDQNGNLLYIFGGSGTQIGSFSTICAVDYCGDKLIAADKNGLVTVFEPTDYGECINNAVTQEYLGDFEQADAYWNKALSYDANLYTAYVGKGKAEYHKGNYTKAMAYFRAVGETQNYSKAKRMNRQRILEKYSTPILLSVTVLGVGGFAFYVIRKKRRKAK